MTETTLVAFGAIAVIRLLHMTCAPSIQWLAIPGVLVTAALVPAWLGGREFPRLGLRGRGGVRRAAGAVGGTCLSVFPVVFLGLWVLTLWHLPAPLRPIVPERRDWLEWLLYQFFYVAVAEEIFFRGYVQANALNWLDRWNDSSAVRRWRRLFRSTPDVGGDELRHRPMVGAQGAAIVISAACFALAHVVVQGQPIAGLTFLPGLILGWLFFRTGSLLAPILFHGLANVSYAVMALALARP